ncbi:hypothetical protein AOQ84DRAFT_367151 [Glonium stellatum]|uniref:Uncharacterized protein n=1 Tax=Glonium stellatum TaxID=574774 RepID=A0A8E2EUI6_9PEZI|nr:hypothetical protein AOQ84DRAFT_367151 [Glonium stellatum]
MFELFLADCPVSEYSDAVGTWVAAAFVLMAAATIEYHKAWMNYVLAVMSAAGRIIKCFKKDHKRGQGQHFTPGLQEMTKKFFAIYASPFIHACCSIHQELQTAKMTLKMFVL